MSALFRPSWSIAPILALVLAMTPRADAAEPPAKAPAEAPVKPRSMADQLKAKLGGGPVALLPSKKGLLATNLAGDKSELIDQGLVGWVMLDEVTDAAWYLLEEGSTATLKVLDLRTAGATPVVVMKKVPVGHDENAAETVTVRTRFGLMSVDGPQASSVIIDLSGKKGPSVDVDPALQELWIEDIDGWKRAVKRAAKLTRDGKKLLKTLGARAQPQVVPLPSMTAERVAISTDNCEEPTLCGQSRQVPGTRLWLVLVGHSCGDGCYTDHALYDHAAKLFVTVGDKVAKSKAPPSEDLFGLPVSIAPNGAGFVHHGTVYDLEKGKVTAIQSEGAGGGFVGGYPMRD